MNTVRMAYNNESAIAGLDALGQRGDQAIRRALRRTSTSVRQVMASAVAKDTGVRVAKVKDEIRVKLDSEARSATVSISGARIPLIEFQARGPFPSRGRGRGVSAVISGERKRYPNAFIAEMRSGHKGVFTRVGASARRSPTAWSKNLPIAELRGPSLPHVFAKYIPLGVERAEEQMAKNLAHEFARAFSQE